MYIYIYICIYIYYTTGDWGWLGIIMNQKSPFTKHLPKYAPSLARSISILFFSVFGLFRAGSLKWIFRKVGPKMSTWTIQKTSVDWFWLVIYPTCFSGGWLSIVRKAIFTSAVWWDEAICSYLVSRDPGWSQSAVMLQSMRHDASAVFNGVLLVCQKGHSWTFHASGNRPCAEVWRDSKEDWTAALEDFEHLALKSGANFVVFQGFNVS